MINILRNIVLEVFKMTAILNGFKSLGQLTNLTKILRQKPVSEILLKWISVRSLARQHTHTIESSCSLVISKQDEVVRFTAVIVQG